MEQFKQSHLKAVFIRNKTRAEIFDFSSGDTLPLSYFSYEAIKKPNIKNHGAKFIIRNWESPRLYSGLIPLNEVNPNYYFGDHFENNSTFILYWIDVDKIEIIYFPNKFFKRVGTRVKYLVNYCNELIREKGTSTARHSLSISSNKDQR